MRTLVVCRCSVRNGMGHLIRARSVSRVLKGMGPLRFVVLGDSFVAELMRGQDLKFTVVPLDEEVAAISESFRPDVVVYDLVTLDAQTFERVGADALTVSLSPIFDRLEQVDVIFHRTHRLAIGWPTAPRTYRGLSYAAVSEHCSRIDEDEFVKNARSAQLSIAVSMGGTDATNKTLQVLYQLTKVDATLLIWVLLGEGYAHSYQELVDALQASQHELILAKTNQSMWRIMRTCSLAILAGGTTTYEAAFAGLPSIVLLEQPEYRFLIDELLKRGVCICAGDTTQESLASLPSQVTWFTERRGELIRMHKRSAELIDGKGIERIVHTISQEWEQRQKCRFSGNE